jgi:MFS family permease
VKEVAAPAPAAGREDRRTSVNRGPNGASVRLGLGANWRQFTLLLGVNALVGAAVGLERATLPLVADRDFGVASATVVLAFVATFGFTKALANLAAGFLAGRAGRRRTLLAGWLIALPVPVLIALAPSWWWIVAANALLGVSQGLTWSTTVIMKIDLVGPERRGLAMGLNEFAGYLAVALAALTSGFAAARWGLRLGPAYLALVVSALGLLLSAIWVRDTSEHARVEQSSLRAPSGERVTLGRVLRRSLWSDGALFSASQAGFVNNLNDGLAWGLFPLYLAAAGVPLRQVALLVAIYPAVWGFAQLGTGALSDRWGRKWPIVIGMVLQGGALIAFASSRGLAGWAGALVALGLGTALVYPALLAAVGDVAPPSWRSEAVGVYRLWRDLGYVAGALLAGILADQLGMRASITAVGALTAASGALVLVRFGEDRCPGGSR